MTKPYPRHLATRIQQALSDTPVVLINGPRQCGKTTLAQQMRAEFPYFSLDDETLLSAARTDPVGFVRRLDCAIIDEVQRAPELLRAIKLSVDKDRRPGRFLLTGSANLLALPRISDSLAGRMEVLTLLPLSHAELARRENNFLDQAKTQRWGALPSLCIGDALVARVLTGGYPEMVLREDASRRLAWSNSYLKALLERDLRDVADIEKLDAMPRLLAVLAQLSGQLTNFTQIGGQLGLDTKTVQKYTGLLEHIFLVKRVAPWGRNELSRIVKSPKLHFCDAGLQASLSRLTQDRAVRDKSRFGATLETWVFGELQKSVSATDDGWGIYHYRDKDQIEVDFVLENPMQEIMGIEVKASATVTASDFKGLRKLQDIAGKKFLTGLILYDGEHLIPFGEKLWAIPLSVL